MYTNPRLWEPIFQSNDPFQFFRSVAIWVTISTLLLLAYFYPIPMVLLAAAVILYCSTSAPPAVRSRSATRYLRLLASYALTWLRLTLILAAGIVLALGALYVVWHLSTITQILLIILAGAIVVQWLRDAITSALDARPQHRPRWRTYYLSPPRIQEIAFRPVGPATTLSWSPSHRTWRPGV